VNPRARELTWHLGFVQRAKLRTPADAGAVLARARALLTSSAAYMLEALVLDPRPKRFPTTRDWDSSFDNIVDPWPNWDELGLLLLDRVPHLGFGGWPASAASAYVHAGLRSAQPLPEPDGPYTGADGLTALTVRYADADEHSGSGEGDERELRYPSDYSAEDLESLEINGVETHVRAEPLRRFLDVIVGHPRIQALRRLDLSGCRIADENAAILLDASTALAGIGAIDLSRNRITQQLTGRVAAALPNARLGVQNGRALDFFMRYVATME
jgi:hypothetical protein